MHLFINFGSAHINPSHFLPSLLSFPLLSLPLFIFSSNLPSCVPHSLIIRHGIIVVWYVEELFVIVLDLCAIDHGNVTISMKCDLQISFCLQEMEINQQTPLIFCIIIKWSGLLLTNLFRRICLYISQQFVCKACWVFCNCKTVRNYLFSTLLYHLMFKLSLTPWKWKEKMKKEGSITWANNKEWCLFEATNVPNLSCLDISERCCKFACISFATPFSFSKPSILISWTPFSDSKTRFYFFFFFSLNFLSAAPEIALTFRCKHNHWHPPDGFGMQMDRALSPFLSAFRSHPSLPA